MQLEQGSLCPLLKKNCVKLECAWFFKLRGTNPNTGELIDEYDCAVKWLPILLIENSQQTRQAGAAIESFRNEMVKANTEMLRANEAANGIVSLKRLL
jgi:hypothetical protein